MKCKFLCCLRQKSSTDSLVQPSRPVKALPTDQPNDRPEVLDLLPLPSVNRTVSLTAISMVTTNSGMSEAGREIRMIFNRCRGELAHVSEVPPPDRLESDDVPTGLPLIRKSSSRLSSVLRPMMSRDSGLSRTSSQKSGKLSRNDSTAERQRELKRALKERLERELRGEGGEGVEYDPDADLMDSFGSKVGSSTFRVRMVPYASLDLDPTPQEECEAIDLSLAQEYRSMLERVECDSIVSSGRSLADVEEKGVGSDEGEPDLKIKTRSKSDSVLIVHEEPLYKITSPPNALARGRTERQSRADENSDLSQIANIQDQDLRDSPRDCPEQPTQAMYGEDGRELKSFWFSDRPPDSGISLRDLDPSEYSGSSISSVIPSWLKKASVLLHPSRYASDPHPRNKQTWLPCPEGADFGAVDGYSNPILDTPQQEPSAESTLSSPSSSFARAINEIDIPLRQPHRSISDAVTIRSKFEQTPSSANGTPERRVSLNSFRQRFFSIDTASPKEDIIVDEKLPGTPKRTISTGHRPTRRRPLSTNSRESSDYTTNVETSDTTELAAREITALTPNPTKSPRRSRFKEEFEDENTPLSSEVPEVNTRENRFMRITPETIPPQPCNGSKPEGPHFKIPDFGSRSLRGGSDTAEEAWGRALRMHKLEKDSGYLEPTGFFRGRRSISPARSIVSSPRWGTSPGASPVASTGPSPPGSLQNSHSDQSLRPSFSRTSQSGSSSLFVPRASRTPSLIVTNRRPSKAVKALAKKPSGTWARFPSHDRARRIGPAGQSDSVVSKDFAPETILPAQLLEQVQQDNTHFSWRERIKRDLTNRFASNSYGHRSSIAVGGGVEYPELEILPSLETPFYMYTEQDESAHEEEPYSTPRSEEQNFQSSSYPQISGMSDFRFDHPRLRRVSTLGIAPDVVIEDYDELLAAESGKPTIPSSHFLSPFDALRPRSETGTLGTSRSSNIGSSNNLSPDKETMGNLFQIPTIDITNNDAAAAALQTGGCLDSAGNRGGSWQPARVAESSGQISIALTVYEDSGPSGPSTRE